MLVIYSSLPTRADTLFSESPAPLAQYFRPQEFPGGAGWLPQEPAVLLQDTQAERGQVPCPSSYLRLANHAAPEGIQGTTNTL